LHPDIEALVARAAETFEGPLVLDADALAGNLHGNGMVRVLTPHPGEMSRLTDRLPTRCSRA
jgi:NAD(P)H-hydrate repair Nnr-like enzyme with NAD(P)H-hydrate dehydratase domain